MPLVACSHCKSESEVDAADLGFKVECPTCNRVFLAKSDEIPPPPPPPKATLEPTGPQEIRCQHCDGAISVNEEDLGHPIECPLCSKVFVARGAGSSSGGLPKYDSYRDRDDDDYRPRRKRRRSRYRDDDDDDDDPVGYAIREISASAIGIIVCGWIDLVICILDLLLIFVFVGVVPPGNGGFAGGGAAGMNDLTLVIGLVRNIFGIFFGGFAIYFGGQMRKAKNYGMSLTVCILAMIPGINPCCILGLIFGIMGLVKLNETRVKKGFQMNRPDFDPDMG